jgi:hypothetical protein
MIFGGRPSLAKYGILCAALAGVLSAEIMYADFAKAQSENYARQTGRMAGEIRALGPLAASKQDLEACESSFDDTLQNRQTISGSTLTGKAHMTMELARLLAESGLEEGAASTAAATMANSPEITLAATFIAKTEGARLRNVETRDDEIETSWTIDTTCDETALPELLSTLGKTASGIALDALDMRSSGKNGIDLRIHLALPKETEDAR